MTFPMNFIRRTGETCAFDKYIPAPCLRKSFQAEEKVTKAGLLICGLGFYELFVNGERITKGALAPYISSPDDILYYDEYDLTDRMKGGENVVGVILGNGMQNCFGASVWDFDKARWRGAPQLSLRLEISFENGETLTVESDESFKTSPSPILFDDLRCGEYYDARKEQKGWNEAGFDDSGWKNAEKAPLPRGEQRLCQAEPIAVSQTLTPVCVTRQGDGWLYDFGVNSAGVCELNLCGKPGQEISLEHGEHLINGELNLRNIQCVPDGYMQKDIYICKGNGAETYIPRFTYHGFRYVLVKGITPEQATAELLTYLVMNSNLPERGGFECSDKTVNALQEMTRRSTLANFYYFPTDCPHREKNGWMGDAAVSAEHTLLNLQAENSYREWLHNIRKAQDDRGALPGLVPTGGWGFSWGNGPAWDCALTWIPYYVYIYRGDKEILRENAGAILRYLHYLSTRIRGDGLVCFGLGD
ncbi:MAG: family 78 glycoside hydrolase catalytic domain, partial [Oscillospiraceae bacterium]|nr:family 78 glycoside hydrolase catalytic domain [Oscillospiraceae bacterium]